MLLIERLGKAIGRINPTVPQECREDAVKQLQRLISPELITNNHQYYAVNRAVESTLRASGFGANHKEISGILEVRESPESYA